MGVRVRVRVRVRVKLRVRVMHVVRVRVRLIIEDYRISGIQLFNLLLLYPPIKN